MMTWTKCLGGLLAFATTSPAWAQAQEQTQRLQQEVDALQTTVKALQAEVKALRAEKAPPATDALAQASSASTPPSSIRVRSEAPAGQESALAQTDTEPTPLPPQQSVSENQDSASRIDNEPPPTDPTLKGFIRIPGTETLIRLGGYAKLDAIYDMNSIGSPDTFVTSTIPVPAPHDNSGNFNMHARQTRFSLEIRRPTIFDESLRFYLETDLLGGTSNTYAFRLRQAYGQLGNTYAGFGWTVFGDLDAQPETLDFQGPPGNLGKRRQAGIHQFFRLGESSSLTLAAEQPDSQVSASQPSSPNVATQNVHGTQHVPDLILVLRTEHDWGHLQLGGLLRQIGYTDFQQSQHTLGGGAQLSGSFKVGPSDPYSDLLIFAAGTGKGIARYLSDANGLNLDAVVTPDGKIDALTGRGLHVAYTHYWSSSWRSNLVCGIARIQHSPLLSESAYHNSDYAAANLIWSPASSVTVGLELLHGRLLIQDNRYGDDTRIQGSLKYSFFK